MNPEKNGPEIDLTESKQVENEGVIEFVEHSKIVKDIKSAKDIGEIYSILTDAGYSKGLIGDIQQALSYENKATKLEKESSGRELQSARKDELMARLANVDKDVVDALMEKIDNLMSEGNQ